VEKVGVFALTEQIVQTAAVARSQFAYLTKFDATCRLFLRLSYVFFSKPHCQRPRKKTEGGIVCILQSGFVALKSATRARSA